MGKVLIWFVIIISTVVLYCLMKVKAESDEPVSYTHLDVYKRQGLSRNVRAGFTSLANTYIIRGRLYTWRTIMIKNKFMAITLTVVLTACLLYTSRCV